MNISFKEFDPFDLDHVQALHKWDFDLEFHHLITPVNDVKALFRETPFLEFQHELQSTRKSSQTHYLIFDDKTPIGQFSIDLDFKHLLDKVGRSAWLGLVIGEKNYWGSGAAMAAVEEFEQIAIKADVKRIELGVFEFNHRARRFYKKLGYREFGIIENFTFWNGRWWDDIRMQKHV